MKRFAILSTNKANIPALDGVRALACLSVIAFHITLLSIYFVHVWQPPQPPTTWKTLWPATINSLAFVGETGVNLFFVLSGFLLFLPFAQAILWQERWPSVRTFYLRRAWRILPGYYVALLLIVLCFKHEYLQLSRWKEWLLFITLFMDSTSQTYKQLNGPFWTLAIEWQFYMLLPLVAWGMNGAIQFIAYKKNVSPCQRLALLSICLVMCMSLALVIRILVKMALHQPAFSQGPFREVFSAALFFLFGAPEAQGKLWENFTAGMLVSCYYVYASRSAKTSCWLRRLSPCCFALGVLWLGGMTAWKYNQMIAHSWTWLDPLQEAYWIWGQWGFGVGYALCILALLFAAKWLRTPFEWKPLRWLGMISFSTYMLHDPLLQVFTRSVQIPLARLGWPHALLYAFFWFWVMLAILPCMLLFYLLIERPGIHLGRRLIQRVPPCFPCKTPSTENRHKKSARK